MSSKPNSAPSLPPGVPIGTIDYTPLFTASNINNATVSYLGDWTVGGWQLTQINSGAGTNFRLNSLGAWPVGLIHSAVYIYASLNKTQSSGIPDGGSITMTKRNVSDVVVQTIFNNIPVQTIPLGQYDQLLTFVGAGSVLGDRYRIAFNSISFRIAITNIRFIGFLP